MPKISIDLASGTIERDQTVIGIDLGTTNSLIASIDSGNSLPYCIGDDMAIVPSAIFFDGADVLVGRQALSRMDLDPEHGIYSVKRLMGKSYEDLKDHLSYFNYDLVDTGEDQLVRIKVNGRSYTPIELSSYILKELKKRAEEKLGKDVNKVVISVPAYFNDAQRQATRDAGKLAGLDVLRIINEPTAASLAYGLGLDHDKANTVAVYDLGGGTFDISILRIQQGIFEVLSTNGDTFLGGDDIDRAIADFWTAHYELGLASKIDHQQLRNAAENAKKLLSKSQEVKVSLMYAGRQLELELTLEQLNVLVKPLLDKTLDSCRRALTDAQLGPGDIDEVVLVGGSTRLPQIKAAVQTLFGSAHINQDLDPDEVVALGTAIEADILAGNRKDVLLLDVTPLSLGIETMGGLMDTIIPRNSKIPNKAGRQYTTSVDGQVNMRLSIFQGEREMVQDNRKIGEFELRGIPAMPAGMPKIEVSFMLDADGILRVSAVELRSGVKQEIKLKPQFGLNDEDINRMLRDSISHAEEDMRSRALAEARTEAEQLVYATEKFMRDNPELLSGENIDQIKGHLGQISNALNVNDKDLIVNTCDELNAYSRQFAEKAMDKAISGALKGKKV